MRHWLRGAGGPSPDQGVEFVPARVVGSGGEGAAVCSGVGVRTVGEASAARRPPAYSPIFVDGREDEAEPPTEQTVGEAEIRELEYSWAGEYDRVRARGAELATLQAIRQMAELDALSVGLGELVGGNSLLVVGAGVTQRRAPDLWECCQRHPGTRVTIEAQRLWQEQQLEALGFELVRRVRLGEAAYATATQDACSARPRS